MTILCDICGGGSTDSRRMNGYLLSLLGDSRDAWDVCDSCNKQLHQVVVSALKRFIESKRVGNSE